MFTIINSNLVFSIKIYNYNQYAINGIFYNKKKIYYTIFVNI